MASDKFIFFDGRNAIEAVRIVLPANGFSGTSAYEFKRYCYELLYRLEELYRFEMSDLYRLGNF